MKKYEKDNGQVKMIVAKYNEGIENAKEIISVTPKYPPYYFKEKSWVYSDDEGEYHIRDDAPLKAKVSFILCRDGYYDPSEKAIIHGSVPEEFQLSPEEYAECIKEHKESAFDKE